jgi:hypothetical protein
MTGGFLSGPVVANPGFKSYSLKKMVVTGENAQRRTSLVNFSREYVQRGVEDMHAIRNYEECKKMKKRCQVLWWCLPHKSGVQETRSRSEKGRKGWDERGKYMWV